MRLSRLLMIVLFLFFVQITSAQNEMKGEIIKLNTSKSYTSKLLKDIYLDKDLSKSYVSFSRDLLRRTEVMLVVEEYSSTSQLYLSDLMLIGKINPDLRHDIGTDFSIETFNPLKYIWNLKEDGSTEVYKIDGTSYYVRILPSENDK